jgi:hypothetical protein
LGSARTLVASVLVVLGPALVACASGHVQTGALTSWESRYVPAAECGAAVALDATPAAGDAGGTGRLVVRLGTFGTSALVPHRWIALAPLAPLDTSTQPVVRVEEITEHPVPFVASLAPGRYALASHAFGYEGRTDTVAVRAGATDTVTIALEVYADALRNRHNCRPRGFRRSGEPACVTDRITTVVALERARDMASPRFRFGVGLPQGDSTDVHVVVDERVCERAARLYGLDTGPPRRVVVVEAGNMYVVYDPAEPVGYGDLNQWLILDKRWRVIARMVL